VDVEECDGRDNDGDGQTDEGFADTDRDGVADCVDVETCDGVDNDGDGATDCADPDCWMDGTCPEICGDNRDNDGDGQKDCLDPECAGVCGVPETCGDNYDNDHDGKSDCADPDCWAIPGRCVEVCTDGFDNDGDGLGDCADPACANSGRCEADCSDGADGDNDGKIDCADADCDGSYGCDEVCDDGRDNDGNGLSDCEDAPCFDDIACSESRNCEDGADNDEDGDVDCDDDDCWGVICHPDGVVTWVTEGRAAAARHVYTYRFSQECYGDGTWPNGNPGPYQLVQRQTTRVILWDVKGKVRANVPTEAGGTTVRTCDWSFDHGYAELNKLNVASNGQYGAGPLVREGLRVDPGCLLADGRDSFLPARVRRVTRPITPPTNTSQIAYRGIDVRLDYPTVTDPQGNTPPRRYFTVNVAAPEDRYFYAFRAFQVHTYEFSRVGSDSCSFRITERDILSGRYYDLNPAPQYNPGWEMPR
jgi:hypothetical protein